MPFLKGYEGVYDQATLTRLQNIVEYVWLAINNAGAMSVSQEDIARMVLAAHESGIPPDRIKEQVTAGILRPIVQDSSEAASTGESADSQK